MILEYSLVIVINIDTFISIINVEYCQLKHKCHLSTHLCTQSHLYLKKHLFKSFFFLAVPLTGDAQKSSSHFHCLKCNYYCTDTNKVVAHRRQHQKMDSINAAGFDKYTPTQLCQINGCGHNGKQTHYHCAKCQYAVLGLSQMEAHKFRHVNENE